MSRLDSRRVRGSSTRAKMSRRSRGELLLDVRGGVSQRAQLVACRLCFNLLCRSAISSSTRRRRRTLRQLSASSHVGSGADSKSNFEQQAAVLFFERGGQSGRVRPLACTRGFDQRLENAFAFETLVERLGANLPRELLAESFGFHQAFASGGARRASPRAPSSSGLRLHFAAALGGGAAQALRASTGSSTRKF